MVGLIRFLLTLALLYYVFQETGWATALSMTLVFIAIEGLASKLGKGV
jgi:hypothetical protein